MNSKCKTTTRIALAVLFAVGVRGVAQADGSSTHASTGTDESHAAFSKNPVCARRVLDGSSLTFRITNPDGIPLREYRALSSPSQVYRPAPTLNYAHSTWRQENPHGLTDRQLEALSSASPVYRPAPTLDYAPSAWRQNNPHGLSEGQLQVLSSDTLAWRQVDPAGITAASSSSESTIANLNCTDPSDGRVAGLLQGRRGSSPD